MDRGNEMETGHAKNRADAARRRKNFKDTLQLKIDLENKYEDALRTRFQTEHLDNLPVTGVSRTSEEEAKTSIDQNALLLKNLKTIMTKGEEASKVANTIIQSKSQYVEAINSMWDLIVKQMTNLGLNVDKVGSAESVVLPFLNSFIKVYQNAEDTDTILINLDEIKSLEKPRTGAIPADILIEDALINDHMDQLTRVSLRDSLREYLKTTYPEFRTITVKSDSGENDILDYYKREGVISRREKTPITSELFGTLIKYERQKRDSKKAETTKEEPATKDKAQRKGSGVIYRPRVGRGVPIDDATPYLEFGKYAIHMPSLHKRVLNVKYKVSLSVVPSLPKQMISPTLADFLVDVLERKSFKLDRLSEEDRKLFHKLATRAEVVRTLGMGEYHGDDCDVERFNLLKGSVMAGQNSPDVLRELKSYILKFMGDGRLRRTDGAQLLSELAILV